MSSSSLDSSKHNCNKPCSKIAAIGGVELGGKSLVGYARVYCKGWSCSYCGPRKAKEMARLIGERAKEHGLSRFVTLTLDPKITPENQHIKYIREVWRKFRVYLKRKFGSTVSFIAVMELHKSGYPHLHVLVDRYIRQEWISHTWNRLGGGKIVFIEKVEDLRKIGWYLGKYLTKDMILSAPHGTRRVTTSRDIKLREPKEETGWRVAPFPFEALYKVAGEFIIEEEKDENGHVKIFIVENKIENIIPVTYDAEDEVDLVKEETR